MTVFGGSSIVFVSEEWDAAAGMLALACIVTGMLVCPVFGLSMLGMLVCYSAWTASIVVTTGIEHGSCCD